MSYLSDEQISSNDLEDEITFRDHTANMAECGGLFLTISYKYISIFCGQSKYCFDNDSIRADQFIKYFEKLTYICALTYDDLIDADHKDDIHFHELDYRGPRQELKERMVRIFNDVEDNPDDLNDSENIPLLYQISIYTNNEDEEAPRLIGFIAGDGIFHPVFFDLEHAAYPKK